jgi:alpha-1,6-mannosyltransferase
VLWLSAAPLLLYSDPWHDEILLPTAVFVPAIGIAAWSLLQARQAHAA